MPDGTPRPAAHDRTPHVIVGGVCLALIAAAAALAVVGGVDEGRLEVAGRPLPGVCSFRTFTGLPCAGCGLTRSWVELLSGRPASSVAYHRLGWVVFAWVALQVVRHGSWLVAARARGTIEAAGRWLDWSLVALVASLLVNWMVTLSRL